jgi:outer membrane protein OmpA-like peptidoglycan-associated protein
MPEVLRGGDSGTEVTEVQRTLVELGYSDAVMATEGYFDEVTERVLRQFQRDYGLTETGEYDEVTAQTVVQMRSWTTPYADAAPAPSQPEEQGDERSFRPDADVAVRADPTYCLFWGFEVGSAELLPAFDPLLDEIAEQLTVVDPMATVDVAGHASASGSAGGNQRLSESRAAAVRDALEARGVDSGRIQWWGEGEQRPWLPEEQGPAAMARNRRVEVVVRFVSGTGSVPGGHDDTPGQHQPSKDGPPRDQPPHQDVPPVPDWPPPRLPVREILDPPPGLPDPAYDIARRIRELCAGLSDALLDLLEFEADAGVLLIAGWSMSAIAVGATILQLLPEFVVIVGPEVATEIITNWSRLRELEDALVELSDTTRPPAGLGGPQDAGVPLPAGVPDTEPANPAAQPDAGAGSGSGAPDGGTGSSTATADGRADDVWAKNEFERGREIQDALARTDYANYLQTDDIPGYDKARNFPLIDFISEDHNHSVSIKTYNPFATAYADGDTIYSVLEHANELEGYAPAGRVTLDIRVPPGTPPEVTQDLLDTVNGEVGGRLEVLVLPWPR